MVRTIPLGSTISPEPAPSIKCFSGKSGRSSANGSFDLAEFGASTPRLTTMLTVAGSVFCAAWRNATESKRACSRHANFRGCGGNIRLQVDGKRRCQTSVGNAYYSRLRKGRANARKRRNEKEKEYFFRRSTPCEKHGRRVTKDGSKENPDFMDKTKYV